MGLTESTLVKMATLLEIACHGSIKLVYNQTGTKLGGD